MNRDLVVQVWTHRAYDLWGLREDETIGQHLLNLDSGLPTADLHPLLRGVITGRRRSGFLQLDAVNRRGRAVRLGISVNQLRDDGDAISGALVMIDDEPHEA